MGWQLSLARTLIVSVRNCLGWQLPLARTLIVSVRNCLGWSRHRYVNRKYDSGTLCCDVDAERPDYDEHPAFRGVRCSSVVLRPGDVLYIPRYWFHQVSHAVSLPRHRPSSVRVPPGVCHDPATSLPRH